MKNETIQVAKGGFPLVSVLTVIFVLAKLFHVIAWPWWVVLAGLWAPLALLLVIFGFVLGLALLAACIR
jgi:hypothetical protein